MFSLLGQQSTDRYPRSKVIMIPTLRSPYPGSLSATLITNFCAAGLSSMLPCVAKSPAPPAFEQGILVRVLLRAFCLLERQSTYVDPRSAHIMNPALRSPYSGSLNSTLRGYCWAEWLRSMPLCVAKIARITRLSSFCYYCGSGCGCFCSLGNKALTGIHALK